MPGDSHAGLWLGPGLFCTPSERPANFHIFFTETDRTGGDAATKKHYFTVNSFPDEQELFDDWWKEWKERPYPEERRARTDKAGFEWTPTFHWKYHRRSGNWLGIGHLLRRKNKRLDHHVEHLAITYSVFHAATKSFSACKSFRIKIDAAAKHGGGTVYFPAGDFLSFTIHLKSHITLYLDQGAVLIGDKKINGVGYDLPEKEAPYKKFQDFGHSYWKNSLIFGDSLHDVAIKGDGMI